VRLVLEVTKTREGRYEGSLTVPGTGAQHDFAGILELLAILEEQLAPEDIQQPRPETAPDWTGSSVNTARRDGEPPVRRRPPDGGRK
jgi:hypothetical protein